MRYNTDNFSVRFALFMLLTVAMCGNALAEQKWTKPSAEELAMTSEPHAAGSAAVYLERDEVTDDALQSTSVHVRLKILTESGCAYAKVLAAPEPVDVSEALLVHFSVKRVEGRTIHPDGAIFPLPSGSWSHELVKKDGHTVRATAFTLPAVTVGSILEYRYEIVQSDRTYIQASGQYADPFISPMWIVQNELYLRKGHFVWFPAAQGPRQMGINDVISAKVTWDARLPAGAEIVQTQREGRTSAGVGTPAKFELNVRNIPPVREIPHGLPVEATQYRVNWYYRDYRTVSEQWDDLGRRWKEDADYYIAPDTKTHKIVKALTLPADSQDVLLRKLYAAVMGLENTDYTPKAVEEKQDGIYDIHKASAIWDRGSGTSQELTDLFVSLARTAGLKAYVMAVSSRDRYAMSRNYPSLRQLQDRIAIVEVDGKEQFFDPGSRYCPYGHLAWNHVLITGLRQTNSGGSLVVTPPELYSDSFISRAAELTLGESGKLTGTARVTMTGAPALKFRQQWLRSGQMDLGPLLVESLVGTLPVGMTARVVSTKNLTEPEAPLRIAFQLDGEVDWSDTGMTLPADLFEARSKAEFPEEACDAPVMFEFGFAMQDDVLLHLPANVAVASIPSAASLSLQKSALYRLQVNADGRAVSSLRQLSRSETLFAAKDYPDLRDFYRAFASKDTNKIALRLTDAHGVE